MQNFWEMHFQGLSFNPLFVFDSSFSSVLSSAFGVYFLRLKSNSLIPISRLQSHPSLPFLSSLDPECPPGSKSYLGLFTSRHSIPNFDYFCSSALGHLTSWLLCHGLCSLLQVQFKFPCLAFCFCLFALVLVFDSLWFCLFEILF